MRTPDRRAAAPAPTSRGADPLLGCSARSKIQAHHRDRLAVVYVRQSTPRQVLENVESTAHTDLEGDRQRLHRHWQQRLERARYQVDRARRQHETVEPENRLVARELEGQWEQALGQQRQLQEEYDRFERDLPAALSRAAILALAQDIPRLWDAATTTPADRRSSSATWWIAYGCGSTGQRGGGRDDSLEERFREQAPDAAAGLELPPAG